MNKADITVVVLLFALLLAWGYYQRTQALQPKPASAPAAQVESLSGGPVEVKAAPDGVVAPAPGTGATAAAQAAAPVAPVTLPEAVAEEVEPEPALPEQTAILSNARVSVVISSHGAAIRAVTLADYRASLDPASAPLVLDFAAAPALAFTELPALGQGRDFELVRESSNTVALRRGLSADLSFERRITLASDYGLKVVDTFSNRGTGSAAIPAYGVRVGPMRLGAGKVAKGMPYLGLDSLAESASEGVTYWMTSGFLKKSPFLKRINEEKDAAGAPAPRIAYRTRTPTLWGAAKDKFFVQILHASGGSADCELTAERKPGGSAEVENVSFALLFAQKSLEPGASTACELDYFVGPKKYTLLKQRANRQVEVMEFGRWFGWICKLLLPTLNGIHAVAGNYGVAIIVLTLLVRIIFWPITHKSTESMKKMQQIQPLVAQLREKHKDNPQKLNQETMALYRQHKVNPMSGCLPILVQIPVFIALFTVLRSAVELRFAPFLWVHDLSEPEGLLAHLLPFGGINILPLFMTATTIWQQKLTPATDPSQQKMAMIMPVVMLFIFYNMASALVLYWTVSQVLSIVQILLMQKRKTGAIVAPVQTAPQPPAASGGRSRRRR